MIQSSYQEEIVYRLAGEEGPDHDKTFTAEVYVGSQLLGSGTGRTKKAAEQSAAYHAICALRQEQV